MVNGSRQPIALLAELPPGPLQITGADLTGTVLDPRELERLAGLEHVRELVPARIGHLAASGSRLNPTWSSRRFAEEVADGVVVLAVDEAAEGHLATHGARAGGFLLAIAEASSSGLPGWMRWPPECGMRARGLATTSKWRKASMRPAGAPCSGNWRRVAEATPSGLWPPRHPGSSKTG